jgi:hypothetical protein
MCGANDLKINDFLNRQNRLGGPWADKSNEEQCLLFKAFSKSFEVTPQRIQDIKDKIANYK